MIRFLKKSYVSLILFVLYAPIILLMIFSFNDSKKRSQWSGFTLRWYQELFNDPQIKSAFYYTIIIAVLATLIATLIGTAAAIGIHRMTKWKKTIMMNVTYIPLLSPDIVTGISLMLLFIFTGIPRGLYSLLLAHITFSIPYVILSVLPKLKQLNYNIYEAALDLGATPWYAFHKVILPEIMPGITAGALLAFTLSIDDFVVSFFNAGSAVSTLSIQIYSMARRGINPKINALSTIMFTTILLLLLIVNLRSAKDAKRTSLIQKRY